MAHDRNGVSDKRSSGPVFVIKLRPLPHVVDPIKALRGLLKTALRRFGLQCTEVQEEDHE
jgi:hypothetical protein